nr:oligomeric, coiled-coil, peripheral membrane protein [Polyrhizophydium stewartii]
MSPEADLTVAQAHEAVLEAELESLKVLYERSESNLATARQQRKDYQTQLERQSLDLAHAQERATELVHRSEMAETEARRLQAQSQALEADLAIAREQTKASEAATAARDQQAREQLSEAVSAAAAKAASAASAAAIAARDEAVREVAQRLGEQILQLREQVEDWSIVCRLGLEQLAGYFEGFGRVLHVVLGEDAVRELARGEEPAFGSLLGASDLVGSGAGGLSSPASLLAASLSRLGVGGDDGEGPDNGTPTGARAFGAGHGEAMREHDAVRDTAQFVQKQAAAIKDVCANVAAVGAYLPVDDCVQRVESRWAEALARTQGRIVFAAFGEGDLALFLPTRNPAAWAAFNVNAPHYFLDTASSGEFADRVRRREWILAFITRVSERVATAAFNPFGLAAGTVFFVCEASPFSAA